MAQNITLLGASYTAVPAVTLPKTGGGTAKFSDASVTTAVASDVAEGKIFLLADGTQATGTASGGGGGSEPTYETVIPLQTFNCNIGLSNNAYGAYITSYSEVPIAGEKYRVTFDGTEYTVTAQIYGSTSTYIGDIGVETQAADATLAYPFEIMYYNGSVLYLAVKGSGSHSLQVDKITSEGGGGGSATLITKNITANGTYSAEDDDADGYSEVTVNVAGGASNIVTGTFKGTTTGAAMDVNLAYTGNGYPVAVIIYPKEGAYNASSGTIYSLVQRYATLWYAAYKDYADSAANYDGTGDEDNYTVAVRYKNNVSSATTYGNYVSASMPISNDVNASNPSGTPKFTVRLKSKTKMSVFIAASSYGFAANVEYTYQVIYSS